MGNPAARKVAAKCADACAPPPDQDGMIYNMWEPDELLSEFDEVTKDESQTQKFYESKQRRLARNEPDDRYS